MSSFPILDLVLGMIFIFFLLSIISNAVVEMLMLRNRARAVILEEWLVKLFDKNSPLDKKIMNHPAVTALSDENKSTDYMSGENFVTALLDSINTEVKEKARQARVAGKEVREIAQGLAGTIFAIEHDIEESTLHTDVKSMLQLYINEAKSAFSVADKLKKDTESELALFRKKVEDWYDSTQERLTGALKKRYARKYTLWIAIGLTVLMNADSVALVRYLYNNPEARAKVAAQAVAIANNESYKKTIEKIKAGGDTAAITTADQLDKEVKIQLDAINTARGALEANLPLGWDPKLLKPWFISFPVINADSLYPNLYYILGCVPGWLFTIFAIMLGAPFWFEMLNKVANIRSSGDKPKPEADKPAKK